MRVSKVAFGYTKNLGNFQSMRADAEIQLEEGESFDDALILASAVVMEALGMELDEEQRLELGRARRGISLTVEEK
jgi:hypothetical protein